MMVACEETVGLSNHVFVVRFKTNIATDNLSNFRVARAKPGRACRENKRATWQQYVSRPNSRTTLKSTWDMVRRISGKYKANNVSHIKSNNYDIMDVKEICNTLAEQFAFNSSSDNYSHMFNHYRLKLEKESIDFDTNDHYSHNDVFTLHELKQAIKISRDTSPDIDTVHYQLLKHLPEDSLLLHLYIFNHIWLTQDFPTLWKTAIIIPVPGSKRHSLQEVELSQRTQATVQIVSNPPPPAMGARFTVFFWHADPLDGWCCCSQKRVMSRPIQVRQL